MYCPQQFFHRILPGDTLYQLARTYHTTVAALQALNPNADPYNLRIGSSLLICPGEGFAVKPVPPGPEPICPDAGRQMALRDAMRLVWSQHVYWTRMLLISIAERLKDQSAVTARLLQNPNDIAQIFAEYYPADAAQNIARLLTEHLQIGAALITALRDGATNTADQLTRQWYINADKMAAAFAGISPYYNYEQLREMLYTHLKLTTQEVSMRLAGKYPEDIAAFGQVEREALSMADYFSSGIMRQFPREF